MGIRRIDQARSGLYTVTPTDGAPFSCRGPELASYWNRHVQTGARIALRRRVGAQEEERVLRSDAWTLVDGTAVVLVHGLSGAHALDHVRTLDDGEQVDGGSR